MKIHIPTILVNKDEFADITTAVKTHQSDVKTNEHEIILSINFPLEKRGSAEVSFLLDISDKRNLEVLANVKEYLVPLLEQNKVAISNLYSVIVSRDKDSPGKKPYNCVKFGNYGLCAKNSGE